MMQFVICRRNQTSISEMVNCSHQGYKYVGQLVPGIQIFASLRGIVRMKLLSSFFLYFTFHMGNKYAHAQSEIALPQHYQARNVVILHAKFLVPTKFHRKIYMLDIGKSAGRICPTFVLCQKITNTSMIQPRITRCARVIRAFIQTEQTWHTCLFCALNNGELTR